MIRNDTDYAFRMLVALATSTPRALVALELATRLGIPHGFAQKVLRRLAAVGILTAKPGRHGGFALQQAAGDISMKQVIEAIQGPLLLNRCLGAPTSCARQSRCRVNAKLGDLQRQVDSFLSDTTLADMV